MLRKIISLVGALLFCYYGVSYAQIQMDSTSLMWSPRVKGMPLPRGIEVSYKANIDYHISSSSDLIGMGKSEIQKNRLFSTKFRFPIINRTDIKVAGGFSYSDEEFKFDDIQTNDYPLYRSLNEKNLKSIGGSLYFLHRVKEKSFIMLRLSGKFNGDYWKEHIGDPSQETFLKYEITPVFGWKINDSKSWGIGLSYSFSFGEPFLFPVIVYNHTFNTKWGVEALLPARLKVRFDINQLTRVNFNSRVVGGSYSIHMDDRELSDFKTLELRRSELNLFLNLEKGITDWLWLDIALGFRFNLKFDVTSDNHRFTLSGNKVFQQDYIIDSYAQPGRFMKVGLYVTPSKKLIEKLGF